MEVIHSGNEATLWAIHAQQILEATLPLWRPFHQAFRSVDREQHLVLGHLGTSCYSSSESALYLVARDRRWDAEILYRSVLEGSYKFAYMCCTDPDVRAARVHEYREILPELARLKQSDRVEVVLTTFPDRNSEEARPLREMILDAKVADGIRNRYPTKSRKQIEQRWGFLDIAKQLKRESPEFFSAVDALAYGFGISSHLIHKDGVGLNLIISEDARSPDNAAAYALAHSARMIGDMLDFNAFRLFSAYRLAGLDGRLVAEKYMEAQPFRARLQSANADWLRREYGGTTPAD